MRDLENNVIISTNCLEKIAGWNLLGDLVLAV